MQTAAAHVRVVYQKLILKSHDLSAKSYNSITRLPA